MKRKRNPLVYHRYYVKGLAKRRCKLPNFNKAIVKTNHEQNNHHHGCQWQPGHSGHKLFLSEGYNIVATVVSDEARKDLPQSKNLHVEVVNLTSEEETAAFVEKTIQVHPQIDGALLLVGGFAMGNIVSTSSSDIKKQLSLNFDTAYHVARPLFQHMKATGFGRLVFIGARLALEAAAGKEMMAYGLSKSLLLQLADYLNAEAKGTNVTATVVVPSTLDTPINRQSMHDANDESNFRCI